jgi:hypothetical protein
MLSAVVDTGTTLSMMTLILIAAARRFKRAAA